MTAKRFIHKTFCKARRNVCRYIVGFDRCPTGYRKNYKEMILDGIFCVVISFSSILTLMITILFI